VTAPDAQRITAFFDQVASDWDEMRLAYYDESVIERLAAAADVRAGMTVGDIGTGTGFVAGGLAGRVDRVIAIDASAGMLDTAAAQLGIENLELRQGDMAAIDLAAARPAVPRSPDDVATLAWTGDLLCIKEVVTRFTPRTREPRRSRVCEALCRTRTGDPFLTMAVPPSRRLLSRDTKPLHSGASHGPGRAQRPARFDTPGTHWVPGEPYPVGAARGARAACDPLPRAPRR